VLDAGVKAMLLDGASETIEPRTAGAWLAHTLAGEAGGTIQLSQDESVLIIGAQLPLQTL